MLFNTNHTLFGEKVKYFFTMKSEDKDFFAIQHQYFQLSGFIHYTNLVKSPFGQSLLLNCHFIPLQTCWSEK